jgi:hypothetical protein
MDATESTSDKAVLIARGRLKEARKLFERRRWDTLPRGRRGQRILAWCAIQAWLAYPSDPEAGVRRVCGGLAPYLKETEWIELIAETKVANKRFSHDQSAMVLEISVRDCLDHGLQFLGCDNDPDYKARHKAKRARNAACQRKRRAACSTGRPCGRPALQLSEEDKLARSNAQAAERMKRYRALRKTPSPDKIRITGEVTEFSVTEPQPPDHPSRARQATRRQAPIKASWDDVVDRIDDPEHAPVALAAGATKPKVAVF